MEPLFLTQARRKGGPAAGFLEDLQASGWKASDSTASIWMLFHSSGVCALMVSQSEASTEVCCCPDVGCDVLGVFFFCFIFAGALSYPTFFNAGFFYSPRQRAKWSGASYYGSALVLFLTALPVPDALLSVLCAIPVGQGV